MPTATLRKLFILFLMMTSRDARAQTRTFFGFSATGYRAESPYPSTGGLGIQAGVERDAERIRLAAIVSTLKTVRTSDHIAICYLGPDGGCLQPPLFPLWLSGAELQASVAPLPSLPIRLIGSAGISQAFDAREYWKGAARTPNDAEWQSIWRGGLELALGSSPHAPRLQYMRTSFGTQPFSMTGMKSLTVVFVRGE